MKAFVLLLALGFGAGRCPVAPGTIGSILGIGWTALLLAGGSLAWYGVGTLLGVAVSVWACGQAEGLLGRKDPGSVVLDELVALPVCFAGWVGWQWFEHRALPSPAALFVNGGGWVTFATFLAFRCFDVFKPWPVGRSQSLPGGWGITADDLLAAVYVNIVLIPVWWWTATPSP